MRFYDDSKATTPHAAATAIAGFESVVLIAGGRNKGLDLGVLADSAASIRAVVAIGEAAPEVAAAFDGIRPVTRAGSMDEAVRGRRRRGPARRRGAAVARLRQLRLVRLLCASGATTSPAPCARRPRAAVRDRGQA